MNLLETEDFPVLLRRGRWALALTEAAISLFLAIWYQKRPGVAWVSMGLLLAYNAVVLAHLYRRAVWRIPIGLLIVLDLLFLGNAAYYTGAATSPYLGLCYLIVFVAALFGDLKGGLIVGALAGVMTISLGVLDPAPDHWEAVRDTAPYFMIVGGFTGYLVGQMKTWFARYQASMARELEQKQTEQTRQHELELAREIQQSSLQMTAPEITGLTLVLRTEPSREVGGDFHAFITEPASGRLGLAVGDVAGKGIAAALVATSIGSVLPYLNPFRGVSKALDQLNRDLTHRLPPATFVTLLYAEVEAAAGTLKLWNAGHPPALIWRARDGHVEVGACGQALPLGLVENWKISEQELTLAPGDLLILHSDGITEARTLAGESYFDELDLRELVQCYAPQGVDALADAIFTALYAGGEPHDDLTLLLCQRAPNL